jgi:lipoprotein signal peptidase
VKPSEIIVKNYGISFGINGVFFILLSIIFTLLFLYLAIKKGRGYWLIFIGAMANLIERIMLGYVRDYWNFFYLGLYNNINDWIIGIGVLICLIDILWKKSK